MLMSGTIHAAVDLFFMEIRMVDEAFCSTPTTPEGMLQQRENRVAVVLLISASASFVFSKIAEAFAGALPCLALVAKGLEVIFWVSSAAWAIAGVTMVFRRIFAGYEAAFPAPEAQIPSEALLQQKMWQDFCQEYREKYRVKRDQEIRLAFAERETIPEDFEYDDVIEQYICPITLCPIRYAVIDPTTSTMYDRAAIETWIDINHSSPTSRLCLERVDLVPATEIQAIIDNRLQHLQERRDAVRQCIREIIVARQQERSSELP